MSNIQTLNGSVLAKGKFVKQIVGLEKVSYSNNESDFDFLGLHCTADLLTQRPQVQISALLRSSWTEVAKAVLCFMQRILQMQLAVKA